MIKYALGAALLLGGCADFAPSGDDDSDGGPLNCTASVTVGPIDPIAPATINASVTVVDGVGLVTTSWTVRDPGGASIDPTIVDADGLAIQFDAPTAGTWQIDVAVSQGGEPCTGGDASIYVAEPGAMSAAYRLRYTPLAGQPAPAQEDVTPLLLQGGADITLAARTLDGGELIAGALDGPTGPLAAYLMLRSPAGHVTELFADNAGAYAARIPSGAHDLIVVPYDPAVAPARLLAQSAAQLDAGYTLDAGDAIGGAVLLADGTPVAGARVAVAVAGLPASVVTTAADGTFAARARTAEGPLAITVIPPDGAALAGLEIPPSAGLLAGPGSQIELRLGDAPVATFDATLVSSAGTSLGGARISFVATSAVVAGQVSLDGGVPIVAGAAARTTVVASVAGTLAPITLPWGMYEVIVEPTAASAGEAISVTSLDLTTGAPGVAVPLASLAVTLVPVQVGSPGGAHVADATVAAVARGVLGAGVGLAVSATTDAQGLAMLELAPGMDYDLVVDPPRDAQLGRARAPLAAGTTNVALALPAALRVQGTLLFPSGSGQPGVRVAAHCDACPTADVPIAETVTGAGGAFVLWLPDPGVR